MAARREEDLGGGRASWSVPFDVIIHYTDKPPATGKREKKQRGSWKVPPLLKVPPRRKGKPGGEEGKGVEMRCRKRGWSRRKKDVDERKNNKSY